jgi:hypothetical protein
MNFKQDKPKCKNCYDKGFSTEYVGASYAMPDFIGDKKYMVDAGGVKIKYCSCKKGKAMKYRAEKKSKFK